MWELDHQEGWVLKNWCFWTVVLEKTLESPLDSKEVKPVNQRKSVLNIHWRHWCWGWSSNTLATGCKESTHWKRSWCWERLRAREGHNRGQDGWMPSPTQWTWVWASSGRWWGTGKPGMLQSTGLQIIGHDSAEWQQSIVYMCQSKLSNSSHPTFPLGVILFDLYIYVFIPALHISPSTLFF